MREANGDNVWLLLDSWMRLETMNHIQLDLCFGITVKDDLAVIDARGTLSVNCAQERHVDSTTNSQHASNIPSRHTPACKCI